MPLPTPTVSEWRTGRSQGCRKSVRAVLGTRDLAATLPSPPARAPRTCPQLHALGLPGNGPRVCGRRHSALIAAWAFGRCGRAAAAVHPSGVAQSDLARGGGGGGVPALAGGAPPQYQVGLGAARLRPAREARRLWAVDQRRARLDGGDGH
eukprot:4204863-Prymnesium_polylepis.1